MVQAAQKAGADAIKMQTYTPDTLTIQSDQKYFKIGGGTLWDNRTLYDLYRDAYTPWEWQPRLKQIAEDSGSDFFSTPFDHTAVAFLEEMNVPAHKIASFEIVDLPLIRRVAETRKPLIISTGMATLAEVDEAVRAARESGATQIALLKCTSAYPAPPRELNLRTIPHLSEAFGVPAGLSDHTLEVVVPVAAVVLGACIIEKHFILSRGMGGPDAAFSLEPEEFKQMVRAVRVAEQALGTVSYETTEREMASRNFRRSLFIVRDVKQGDEFTHENVRSIRPGHGLSPKYLNVVLGRRASRDLSAGTPVEWTHLAG